MLLELKHIYKDYLQGKIVVPVLKDINISIEEGEEGSNIEQDIKENEKVSEAISALQVLGYSKREIVEALQTIEVTSLSVEDIIKKGLANLAKKL